MTSPLKRGQSGNQVSNQFPSTAKHTPSDLVSTIIPYGLRLRQRVGQAIITNVSASGTTVTFTAANNFSAGQTLFIYDVNPGGYNFQGVTVASASATQFTVSSTQTGTYVSGGIAQVTGTLSVTIPSGINWVYAICVGGGGGGATYGGSPNNGGGGAGGIAWGWTLAQNTCLIGRGAQGGGQSNIAAGYTRYGHIIAGYGGSGRNAPNNYGGNAGLIGGAGGGDNGATAINIGTTNYFGQPPGTTAGGVGIAAAGGTSSNGGNGISGGGGGSVANAGSTTYRGGNGGSGLIGGGGGNPGNTTGSRIAGVGGNGFNILTGVVTLGGSGIDSVGSYTASGGGGGLVSDGGSAFTVGTVIYGGNGGLGGGGGGAAVLGGSYSAASVGGNGGPGILYIFY